MQLIPVFCGAAHSPVFSGAAHSPVFSDAALTPVSRGAARSPVCAGGRLGRAQVPAARRLRVLRRPERHRAQPGLPRGGRRRGRQGQGRCPDLCAAPLLLRRSCGARLCLWSLQAGTLVWRAESALITRVSGNMGGTMDDSKTKAGGMQSRRAPAGRCKRSFLPCEWCGWQSARLLPCRGTTMPALLL